MPESLVFRILLIMASVCTHSAAAATINIAISGCSCKFMSTNTSHDVPCNNNAKQKHLGCKKGQGQSEATLQTGRRNQKV